MAPITNLRREIFRLTVPNDFLKETFRFSESLQSWKVSRIRGEGVPITFFRRISIFVSHSTDKIRRGTIRVSEKFWCRKIIWIRGGDGVSRNSVEHLLSQLPIKKNVAQPFWVAKNFWYRTTSRIRGAGSAITTFRRNFFESE